MSEYECLEFSSSDGVANITLDRPRIGNGMSLQLLGELNQALMSCESDDAIRVVVIRGNGKNFCVGADLTDKATAAKPAEEHILTDHAPNLHCIRNSSKVYICAMRGAAALEKSGCDAIVLLGTGMPTLPALASCSGWSGPPVVSSTLALVWRAVLAASGTPPDQKALLDWLSAKHWRARL